MQPRTVDASVARPSIRSSIRPSIRSSIRPSIRSSIRPSAALEPRLLADTFGALALRFGTAPSPLLLAPLPPAPFAPAHRLPFPSPLVAMSSSQANERTHLLSTSDNDRSYLGANACSSADARQLDSGA
ncbi:hypothetical protein ACQY0O_004356 [Thecaphora frezii]